VECLPSAHWNHIVVLFGPFAVLLYIIGKSTDRKSLEANQLTFPALCLSSNSSLTNSICEEVLSKGSQSLPSLETTVWGPLQTILGGNNTTSLTTEDIISGVMGGLGVIVTCAGLAFPIRKMYRERFGQSPRLNG